MWCQGTIIFSEEEGEEEPREKQDPRSKRKRVTKQKSSREDLAGLREDCEEPREDNEQSCEKQAKVTLVQEGMKQIVGLSKASSDATSATSSTGRKRKALNKKEKLNITKRLVSLKPEIAITVSLSNVKRQLPTYNVSLKELCTSVYPAN